MLEPYVWYDPHEIIRKLEGEIFSLKAIHICQNGQLSYYAAKIKEEVDRQYNCEFWKI